MREVLNEQSIPIQGDGETSAEIPEKEDKSNNKMKHNTDRGGDLEVEDDGPY